MQPAGRLLLSPEDVLYFVRERCRVRGVQSLRFNELQVDLRATVIDGRLNTQEQRLLTDAIRRMRAEEADRARIEELNRCVHSLQSSDQLQAAATAATPAVQVTLFTAYSNDYAIGRVCEAVNRRYALKHGYGFVSHVSSSEDMLRSLRPKGHCAWFKVKMLNDLLARDRKAEEVRRSKDCIAGEDEGYKRSSNDSYSHAALRYLVWIDADAVVINHERRIEDIVRRCQHRDLILAEDMNPGCLLNSGVLIVRCNKWNQTLWTDVWNSSRYDNVTFYEQSALVRSLNARDEGLSTVKPFHSFLADALLGDKTFAHVTVMPHQDLNSHLQWPRVLQTILQRRREAQASLLLLSSSSSTASDDDVNSALIAETSLLRASPKEDRELVSVSIGTTSGDDGEEEEQDDELHDSQQQQSHPHRAMPDTFKATTEELDFIRQSFAEQGSYFIFHPAGLKKKMQAVRSVLDSFGLNDV